MKSVLYLFGGAVLLIVVWNGPYVLRQQQADAFLRFARGGVTVRSVQGSAMAGSMNPIAVPTGVGLMMGATFQFTNSNGQAFELEFCNGHPDYHLIEDAIPSLERGQPTIKFKLAEEEMSDPHTEAAWWVRHMFTARDLRVVPKR